MSGMRFLLPFAAVACLLAQEYPLGPDHERHPGVPVGQVTKYTLTGKVYPGTTRDYWVYVPAQYKAASPASVMVVQDGGGWINETGRFRAPIVLDNLIHQGQMPVTIGIFVNPGVMPALTPEGQDRFHRSFEYDAMSDRYARFLVEDLLPEVDAKYNLSKDPNDRAIAGSSSGASAAFIAAWHRPDQFRRVLSFIGSFTNLRGAQTLSSLIRKTEPKPLRIFLQDGRNDQSIYAGSWFRANEDMQSAFAYAGYDHTWVVGNEAHNGIHGSAILPDALRWLWRKDPIRTGTRPIEAFVDPTQTWQVVSEGHTFAEGPTFDRDGNFYFTDVRADKLWKIDTAGKKTVFKDKPGQVSGLRFAPDGNLYACRRTPKQIVAFAMDGTETVLAEADANDLAVTAKGEIYFTETAAHRVWYVDALRNKRMVHEGIVSPNGIALSPDQSMLFVSDSADRWVWSFQRAADGSLANGEPFHRLELFDPTPRSSADGLAVDTDGFLYVTTNLGLQIVDPAGRVNAILNKPQPGPLASVAFGGANLDTLYITAGDKVYRRPAKRKGVNAWTVTKPPKPKL
ncbi:MAG: SMP-30/gluconolactonase/LRE family protein [Bryobacteraceae bacterium]|nr:SMP-30/gluconolactonase/LRE family protein [Bryobacteraceae bacterium]